MDNDEVPGWLAVAPAMHRDSLDIGVASHAQMLHAASDYADDYNLNDIGLAMRLHGHAAV